MNLKKAVLCLAASLIVPVTASAQESVENASAENTATAESAAPATDTAAVESTTDDTNAAPVAASNDSENTNNDNAAQAPEQPAEQPETDMAQQVQANQNSKEARKEAMRNLTTAFPEEKTPAPAATEASQPQPAPAPVAAYIPPSFKTTERMPRIEHHGVFRTQLNYFGNYDLNTRGTSPVAVPLNSSDRGESAQSNISLDDSDAHLGATMRLRYQPTVHITESIRLGGTFDILDNLALGTTPNGLRENWGANEFFSFNGAQAVDGSSFGTNALKVKALYGEADTILGTFRAGRVPTHWGMGLVYNDGGLYKRDQQIIEGRGWSCLSCDSTDAVDKIEWRIRDPFFDSLYLQFSWDFVNSGIASYANLQKDSYGQAFDLAESDDVMQFTISVFDRPISQQEIDKRYQNMFETKHWVADWGAFYSYRKQEQAADPSSNASYNQDGANSSYDLFNKGAEAHVFDLWGRFFIPLPHEIMLRLEGEFVGVVGSVELDSYEEGEERDILQFGAGIEAEVWWKDLIAGVKTGFAWADNMEYSGHQLVEQNDDFKLGSLLRFDSSYRIDEIMFHELMGGINNAWYLNINAEYKFPLELSQMTMSLGARLDMMTAVALVKDATPGKSSWYGFEADLKLFYEEADRFRFEIGAGVFAPGDAWENDGSYKRLLSSSLYDTSSSDSYDPEVAWNVIANLYFMF